MSYNIVTTRPAQVILDQAALQAIQADLARKISDLERLRIAIETLAQVNDADRFAAAAMALCNQLASRYKAERASLGFLKGRYVRLAALSHTEKFTRQMRLVQDIEAGMEECLDQDVEILHPIPADASYVSRSTETLANRHGPNVICSLPLRRKGEVVAVLTLERKADKPFVGEEVETLRLTCDLITPRLVNLYEHDRWFGARAAAASRRGLALLVGPKHTWIKAAVIAIAAFTCFAVFAKGTHHVQSPFTFEAIDKEVVSAPFDGVLKTVRVLPGDTILSEESVSQIRGIGDIVYPLPNPFALGCFDSTLATFDTRDLVSQLASAAEDRNSHRKKADVYFREDKTAEYQGELAEAEKSQSEMDTLQYKIDRATIQAPLDGIVFTGDLKSKIGTRISVGDPLFEVGDPASLRAELSVPEDDSSYLLLKQTGKLATASYPGEKINFTIETIFPVAEVKKDQNVFVVRGAIDPTQLQLWMRPGMEGVAKVDVGRERYAWLWTRRLVNWIRMKTWF